MKKLSIILTLLMPFLASAQWNTISRPKNDLSIHQNWKWFSDSEAVLYTRLNAVIAYYTSNQGKTWKQISTPRYYSARPYVNYFSPKDAIFLISDSIFFSHDSGRTYTLQVLTPVSYRIRTMNFITKSRGFIIGENGDVCITTDAGKSWNMIGSKVFKGMNYNGHMSFPDTLNGFVRGYDAEPTVPYDYPKDTLIIEVTSDGGKTWEERRGPLKSTKDGSSYDGELVFVNKTTGFFPSQYGLFKTTDGGYHWHRSDAGINVSLSGFVNKVYFTDTSTGYALNYYGIWKTEDGGNTWGLQMNRPNVNTNFVDFQFYGKDLGVLVDQQNPRTIYLTTNGGGKITYTDIVRTKPTENVPGSLWPNPANEYVYLKAPETFGKSTQVSIYDYSGKLIIQQQQSDLSVPFRMNIQNLRTGIYLVKMQDERGSIYTSKMEVTR